jgi:hypothetical protein
MDAPTRPDVDVRDYIERLYKAFAEAPRPTASELTPHRCGECDEVAARLSAHYARDVPYDDMLWLGDSLPLLSPKAFRYYLPRFIEFCLATPNSSLAAVINYNLAPSGDLDVGERNRFFQFSEAERRAVLEFVQYRASLPESAHDRAYLEDAEIFWSVRLTRGPTR